jgi:hypothetical protein
MRSWDGGILFGTEFTELVKLAVEVKSVVETVG